MSDVQLDSLLPDYFDAKRSHSEATRKAYRRGIRQYSEHLGHPATLVDLNEDALTAWMLATVDSGLTHATANHRMDRIRALWAWCGQERIVDDFPTVTRLHDPKRDLAVYTMQELRALFDACDKQTGTIGARPASLWWSSLIHFLFDTGERASVTLAVTWSMIDLKMARVSGNIRKDGTPAVYRLSNTTVKLLAESLRLGAPEDLVWPAQFGFDHFVVCFRRLTADAGLPYTYRISGTSKIRWTVISLIEADDNRAAILRNGQPITERYIDRAMVLAHSNGTWPRGIDPMASGKGSLLGRLFGRKN